jgi:hypothetical protein
MPDVCFRDVHAALIFTPFFAAISSTLFRCPVSPIFGLHAAEIRHAIDDVFARLRPRLKYIRRHADFRRHAACT